MRVPYEVRLKVYLKVLQYGFMYSSCSQMVRNMNQRASGAIDATRPSSISALSTKVNESSCTQEPSPYFVLV